MEKLPEKKQPLYRGRAKSERNSGTELKTKYTFLDKSKRTREYYIRNVKNIGVGKIENEEEAEIKKVGEDTAARLADQINPEAFYLKKIKRRAELPAKNIMKMVYDSAAKKNRMIKIAAPTGKWKKVSNFIEDQSTREWSELTNGMRWYYHLESQKYYFEIKNKNDLPEGEINYNDLSNETLSKEEWEKKGLKVPIAIPYDKEAFLNAVKSGMKRYHTMSKGIRSLSHKEQESRTAEFKRLYKTDNNNPKATSSLHYIEDKIAKGTAPRDNKDGYYVDIFKFDKKQIFADHTYAYSGKLNDDTVDPDWKDKELSLSEVIYQQMHFVKKDNPHLRGTCPSFDTYKSGHIAGPDGVRIVKAIRSISGTSDQDKLEFTPADQGFYALLGIPNGSAAVWLVNDHGDELGIDGIEKVVLTSGNSLKVYFKEKR